MSDWRLAAGRRTEPDPKRILTPAEAARAIYIDFEGRIDESPVVLGVLYAEGKNASPDRLVLRHDVLDPAFRTLVGVVEFENCYRYVDSGRTLPQALADILQRARSQGRLVVSWSRYESRVIEAAGSSAWALRHFGARYVDGKVMARRWRGQVHPDVTFAFDTRGGANKLTRYLALIGYELPSTYGSGQVGSWLRLTRETLERRSGWDEFSAVQQQRWISILEHNAHDLFGMRAVVEQAAADLHVAST